MPRGGLRAAWRGSTKIKTSNSGAMDGGLWEVMRTSGFVGVEEKGPGEGV